MISATRRNRFYAKRRPERMKRHPVWRKMDSSMCAGHFGLHFPSGVQGAAAQQLLHKIIYNNDNDNNNNDNNNSNNSDINSDNSNNSNNTILNNNSCRPTPFALSISCILVVYMCYCIFYCIIDFIRLFCFCFIVFVFFFVRAAAHTLLRFRLQFVVSLLVIAVY